MSYPHIVLAHGETLMDLLELAIRMLTIPSEWNMDNLTHIAEACKSYSYAHPIAPDYIQRTITPAYMTDVIIPEICDNIAREEVRYLLNGMVRDVWNQTHPNRPELPEHLEEICHGLECDDSQHSAESWEKANEIRRDWAETHDHYLGQWTFVLAPMLAIMDSRIREDVKVRARVFKEARE